MGQSKPSFARRALGDATNVEVRDFASGSTPRSRLKMISDDDDPIGDCAVGRTQ